MNQGSLARRPTPSALPWLIACLLAACSRTPQQALDHLARGDAALAQDHYATALSAYSHARELAPQDPSVQQAMMRARVHLIAEDAARLTPDAFEEAKYEAQVLLDADRPRAAVYLTALGNVMSRQGDVEAAKQKYAEALRESPTSALAHTALGLALLTRKEDASRAKAEFELALKAKPEHTRALAALGQLKVAEGDAAAAVDKLETALRAGDDFQLRMSLGQARALQRKPAEAAEQFRRATQLDPRSAEAFSALGEALAGLDRFDEAERALREAFRLRPDPAFATSLAFALLRQRKLAPAATLFAQVLAEEPGAIPAMYGAGMAADELGNKPQAAAYYQRLLTAASTGQQRQAYANLLRDAQARLAAISALPPASSSSDRPAAPRR